jgi:hypothetical protein
MDLTGKSPAQIAAIIYEDWGATKGGINYAAKPYLEAMLTLDSIDDMYGLDSGLSIVSYFLANAGTYRGETAKATKAALKKLKASAKAAW